MFHLKSAPRAL